MLSTRACSLYRYSMAGKQLTCFITFPYMQFHCMPWLLLTCTVHGKYLVGEKFWRTLQIKAIGGQNLTNKQQSVHMPSCICNIGEENFGEYLTIRQICQFFPYQIFPVYSMHLINRLLIKYHEQASHESDFVCCMWAILCVLHMNHTSVCYMIVRSKVVRLHEPDTLVAGCLSIGDYNRLPFWSRCL